MKKLMDALFWCLDNPVKVRKVWISTLAIFLIVVVLLAVVLVIGIPEVIENSIIGK